MRTELERIAWEAGQRMAELRREGFSVYEKEGTGNYVTDADRRVQELLRESLYRLLPEAGFVGEESEEKPENGGGLRWIVDPIDGTANYIRRIPHSAVSIGLVEENSPVAGVVFNPFTGALWSGQQGKGAYLGGERIYAADRPLARSVISVGFSAYYREQTPQLFGMLQQLFERGEDLRSLGSASLDLCMIGSGGLDAFVELRLQPWDYTASACILTEAGGRISAMDGSPLPYDRSSSLLAAGPGCYEEVLRLIAMY